MKKKILIILLSVFIVIAFSTIRDCVLIIGIFSPSKNDVKKMYYANEAELNSVCAFLQEAQYTDIRIELEDTTESMTCYLRNNGGGFDELIVEFIDSSIISDLEELKKSGFIRILKEYDYICFQSWGSFGDSIGLINSQGKKPNTSELNTVYSFMEEIGETGWYYYKFKYE